jgi:hypothetical protein
MLGAGNPLLVELLLQFRSTVAAALQNHDLWHATALTDHTTHRTIRRFSHYFEVAKEAHLSTSIVSLYLLLETRRDTVNLRQLLQALATADPEVATGLREQLAEELAFLDRVRPKIAILRNKVFAHREKGAPPERWFEQADLSVIEVHDVIRAFQRVTEEVQRCVDGTIPTWPRVHGGALAEIVEVLRRSMEPATR